MKLAENIYALRKSKGLSQEKLAEKMNVSRQTISNWELGETSPNPDQLVMLSKVFEKSIDEMVGNEIKSEPQQIVSDNTKTLKFIYSGVILFFGLVSGVLAATANRFQVWEIFVIAVTGGMIGAALAAVIHGIIKIKNKLSRRKIVGSITFQQILLFSLPLFCKLSGYQSVLVNLIHYQPSIIGPTVHLYVLVQIRFPTKCRRSVTIPFSLW